MTMQMCDVRMALNSFSRPTFALGMIIAANRMANAYVKIAREQLRPTRMNFNRLVVDSRINDCEWRHQSLLSGISISSSVLSDICHADIIPTFVI